MAAKNSAKVKVYTLPNCPYCHMAKVWLDQNDIPYTEFNVADNDEAREYIVGKSGKTQAPQIEIGDEVIVGFDREALEKLLLKKKKQ